MAGIADVDGGVSEQDAAVGGGGASEQDAPVGDGGASEQDRAVGETASGDGPVVDGDDAPVRITRLAPGEVPPEGAVLLRDDEVAQTDDASTTDARRTQERRTDTRGPRRARLRALKILFQADLRGQGPEDALARLAADPRDRQLLDDLDDGHDDPFGAPGELEGFTQTLVIGVHEHRERIDALITRFARRWAISRMPVVDRTVLRMATYELLFEPTSPAVVINEAVELAKALSTDDSGRFINGVLESVRKEIARQARLERNGAEPDAR